MNILHAAPSRLFKNRLHVWALGLAISMLSVFAFSGCDKLELILNEQKGGGQATRETPAVSELNILVLDDPELAAALERWKTEWKTLSGGAYTVTEVAQGLPPDWGHKFDAIIYPSDWLGELSEQNLVEPIRTGLLEKENYGVEDIFRLVWQKEVCWENEPRALPLGSPVFVLAYRADIFEQQNQPVPSNWDEYQDAVEYFKYRANWGPAAPAKDSEWQAAVEPLAEGWAARLFLARSAVYVKHRSQVATYFETESMLPLLDTPPYERALEELAAAAGALSLKSDAHEAYRALCEGKCVMALTWPESVAATSGSEKKLPSPVGKIEFAELPGGTASYNQAHREWDDRVGETDSRVTYLGAAGRLGSVSRATRNAPSAFRFLAWLTQAHSNEDITTASRSTTLFRRSQVPEASKWVAIPADSSIARQYGRTVETSMSREQVMVGPRIPGTIRYLAALDSAVRSAASEEQEPTIALERAANEWKSITNELGLEAQKAAYLHSLGFATLPTAESEEELE